MRKDSFQSRVGAGLVTEALVPIRFVSAPTSHPASWDRSGDAGGPLAHRAIPWLAVRGRPRPLHSRLSRQLQNRGEVTNP